MGRTDAHTRTNGSCCRNGPCEELRDATWRTGLRGGRQCYFLTSDACCPSPTPRTLDFGSLPRALPSRDLGSSLLPASPLTLHSPSTPYLSPRESCTFFLVDASRVPQLPPLSLPPPMTFCLNPCFPTAVTRCHSPVHSEYCSLIGF